MQFGRLPPDVIRSVTHRWLLKYWNELRRDRGIPCSAELVADDLSRMTDSLMFCDVIPNGADCRFYIRFRGRRILETYGECDGRYLEDTLPPISREATLKAYAQAVDERRPVYTIAETQDRAGKPVDFERLLLPFGGDDGGVDRILTALEWVSIENGFASDQLLRTQPRAPHYIVWATIGD